MSAMTLRDMRPWPCEAECDAPECRERVSWVLHFDNPETPGLDTLYLCHAHAAEARFNYNPPEKVA